MNKPDAKVKPPSCPSRTQKSKTLKKDKDHNTKRKTFESKEETQQSNSSSADVHHQEAPSDDGTEWEAGFSDTEVKLQEEKNKLKIPKLEETLQQAKDNASDVEEEEDEKQSSQKSGSFFFEN